MSINKRTLSFFICATLLVSTTGCTSIHRQNTPIIPTEYYSATYNVDVTDKEKMVGNADYVFVGYVEKIIETEYVVVASAQTDEGLVSATTPYTKYAVSVEYNIKGQLDKDAPIEVAKCGGLCETGDTYYIYEGDFLPECGSYYIFLAYVQNDGSLLVVGENSNVFVSASKNKIEQSEVYKEYVKAYTDEAKIDRTRFTSIYDESI